MDRTNKKIRNVQMQSFQSSNQTNSFKSEVIINKRFYKFEVLKIAQFQIEIVVMLRNRFFCKKLKKFPSQNK